MENNKDIELLDKQQDFNISEEEFNKIGFVYLKYSDIEYIKLQISQGYFFDMYYSYSFYVNSKYLIFIDEMEFKNGHEALDFLKLNNNYKAEIIDDLQLNERETRITPSKKIFKASCFYDIILNIDKISMFRTGKKSDLIYLNKFLTLNKKPTYIKYLACEALSAKEKLIRSLAEIENTKNFNKRLRENNGKLRGENTELKKKIKEMESASNFLDKKSIKKLSEIKSLVESIEETLQTE